MKPISDRLSMKVFPLNAIVIRKGNMNFSAGILSGTGGGRELPSSHRMQ
jgi:hypothetical protein